MEMESDYDGVQLVPVLVLLAAAVIAGPLCKRLGFGSVLGYLAAGIAIGPSGMRVLDEPSVVLHIAELGIVLFLFVIGLEMQPARLWGLRRQIFVLGAAQVLACIALLMVAAMALGLGAVPAFVIASGFALTSTAIVMQLLEDKHLISSPEGQQIVSILLLEDLAIVPLLAVVAFLAPGAHDSTAAMVDGWSVLKGVAAVAGIIVTGRYLLNPLFRLLAESNSREVMTAAALLVVLGAAYAVQQSGMSMAMGAFLAGVLLSGSSFRFQLEMDVEPFRGTLLGLFFLAIGMSLDLQLVVENLVEVLIHVFVFMLLKAAAIFCIALLLGAGGQSAFQRSIIMAQGGEFAFVLFAAAVASGVIDGEQNTVMSAVVIVSMMLAPIAVAAMNRVQGMQRPPVRPGPDGLAATVLIVGFGRVGQIAGQLLLERGHGISIIDTDVEVIDVAREHDFQVYYGDGTRLDILHAAGAAGARLVLVCVDKEHDATRIVELVKSEFPAVMVVARAVDRRHSLDLIRAGADFQLRETFESALVLGGAALQCLGLDREEVAAVTARVRERDGERLQRELTGGQGAGKAFFSGRPRLKDEASDAA